MNNKPIIYFATPCFGGQISAPTVQSFIATTQFFNRVEQTQGVGWYWDTDTWDSLISRSRNVVSAKFLSNPVYTHLMFIDGDIEWPDPGEIIKLILHDRDIVAGIYPKKQEPPRYVINFNDPENIEHDGHVFRVRDVGTGFLMIKRSVFERMIPLVDPLVWNLSDTEDAKELEQHYYGFFDCFNEKRWREDGRKYALSEDYAFCRRAQELGIDICMDPTIKLNHWGVHCYHGDVSKILVPNEKSEAA